MCGICRGTGETRDGDICSCWAGANLAKRLNEQAEAGRRNVDIPVWLQEEQEMEAPPAPEELAELLT